MAANIKFKRTSTSTLPTGLTFAEPAFVLGAAGTTTVNQLYLGDNSGGRVWIGAQIENTVTNWTGTAANSLLATQQAIDARISSRITSSGGFTFQGSAGTAQTITPGDTVTFAGGTGISTTAGATDTITFVNTGVLSVNGSSGSITNVAKTNVNNNFTASQSIDAVSATFTIQDTASTAAYTVIDPTRIFFSPTGTAGVQYLYPNTTNASPTNITLPAQSGTLALASQVVSSFNGSTGAVTGVASFNGSTGAVTGVSSFNGSTGAVVGVSGLTGTANQITVSGTTGSITLSLPNAVTMPGSLTVTGNLTVNGTTTTINSTTVTVEDPIISIGGLTGGIAPAAGDVKDRGIVALYRNTADTAGLTGFFGIDQSTGYFTFVPNATVASEVVSGTVGSANFNGLISSTGVTLSITSTTDTIDFYGGGSSNTKIRLYDSNPLYAGTLSLGGLAANQTYTLPNATGTVLVYGASGNTNQITSVGTITSGTWNGATLGLAYGGTNKSLTAVNGGIVWTDADSMEVSAAGSSGNILKSNGAAAPTWIDPTASGFTAFVATNVAGGGAGSLHYQTALNTTGMLSLGTANYILTAGSTAPQWTNPTASGFTAYAATNASNIVTAEASGTYYLAMASAINATGTGLFLDTTATALTYVTSTGTLTCTAVDALIDGGAY